MIINLEDTENIKYGTNYIYVYKGVSCIITQDTYAKNIYYADILRTPQSEEIWHDLIFLGGLSIPDALKTFKKAIDDWLEEK